MKHQDPNIQCATVFKAVRAHGSILTRPRFIHKGIGLLAIVFGMCFGLDHSQAVENSLPVSVQAPILRISVVKNKSLTFKFDKPFATSVVGEPTIADVLPLSPQVFYILGKKIGNTNIVFFDEQKNLVGVIDVEVKLDAPRIISEIRSGTPVSYTHLTLPTIYSV